MSETLSSKTAGGPQADPEVVLPAAVRRAAAEAERLAAEATAAAQTEAGGTPDPPGEPAEERRGGVTPSPPPAGSDEVQLAPPRPQPRSQPQAQPVDWEQRYRTIQGKYDAEVPSLAAQLRQTQARLVTLEGERAEANMRAARTAAPARPNVPAEDIDAYGEEFIEKVRSWAAPVQDSGEVSRVQAEVAAIKQQMSTTAVEQNKIAVMAALDYAVPGWREQNNDPGFMAWLELPEPFSGLLRKDMITNAYTSGDAARTIRFFQAYRAEHTATQPQGHDPAQTSNGAGSVSLAELAAPGRGRSEGSGAQPQKRIWTQPQIQTFYREVAAGRYAFDEAAKARIEADIFAAPVEGRLR